MSSMEMNQSKEEGSGASLMPDSSSSHEIDIMRFASYRRAEIDQLMTATFLAKPKSKINKSLFQLLPRHMRRRTMGFIRKRLPHRIRQAAVMKAPTTKANKRPSRKYRRKPANLVGEYERRKRAEAGRMWLETHIWHAKRFHMSKVATYGYRLALFDNCKSKRPAFRALKSACCIHDESYHVCHELTGPQDVLLDGLARVCSSNLGLTFAARIFIDGRFEGRVVLYETDRYPLACIGPCRFVWKPEEASNETNAHRRRTLWIWTHPSIYEQFQRELLAIWNLIDAAQDIDTDDSPQVKKIKLTTNERPREMRRMSKFKSSDGNNVELECLKDELVRFKLLGPFATTILANVLTTFESSNLNETELKMYENQIQVWEKIKSSIRDTNELTSSLVLGLLVKDPRLVLPKKKSFNQVRKQNEAIVDSPTTREIKQEISQQIKESILSRTHLWEKRAIEELNASKKTTREINKLREEYVMPGTRLTSIENVSRVPVMLIQNSCLSSRGIRGGFLLTGWDLVLPKSWAMPFWMCCVHFGARAIAQNELNYLYFESGNLQFPNEYIDTNSSRVELDKLKLELHARHTRRPASKRVNFLKNRFLTPFSLPIPGLVSLSLGRDEPVAFDDYFILRDLKLLAKLQPILLANKKSKSLAESMSKQELEMIENAYVPVRLECQGRGTLEQFSLIYRLVIADKDGEEYDTCGRKVMGRILTEHRARTLERLVDEEAKKSSDKKPAAAGTNVLNKLIRAKYDPNELLLDERTFIKFHTRLNESLGNNNNNNNNKRQPIGFVINGGFNLACGKYAANGFVLAREVISSAKSQVAGNSSRLDLVSFRSPKSSGFKTARITHVFN